MLLLTTSRHAYEQELTDVNRNLSAPLMFEKYLKQQVEPGAISDKALPSFSQKYPVEVLPSLRRSSVIFMKSTRFASP